MSDTKHPRCSTAPGRHLRPSHGALPPSSRTGAAHDDAGLEASTRHFGADEIAHLLAQCEPTQPAGPPAHTPIRALPAQRTGHPPPSRFEWCWIVPPGISAHPRPGAWPSARPPIAARAPRPIAPPALPPTPEQRARARQWVRSAPLLIPEPWRATLQQARPAAQALTPMPLNKGWRSDSHSAVVPRLRLFLDETDHLRPDARRTATPPHGVARTCTDAGWRPRLFAPALSLLALIGALAWPDATEFSPPAAHEAYPQTSELQLDAPRKWTRAEASAAAIAAPSEPETCRPALAAANASVRSNAAPSSATAAQPIAHAGSAQAASAAARATSSAAAPGAGAVGPFALEHGREARGVRHASSVTSPAHKLARQAPLANRAVAVR